MAKSEEVLLPRLKEEEEAPLLEPPPPPLALEATLPEGTSTESSVELLRRVESLWLKRKKR